MTQAAVDPATTGARSIVSGFYQALAAGDVDGLTALVEGHFAEDAVLIRPESLPGGGRTESARRIARFVKGAASANFPVTVGGIYDSSTSTIPTFFVDVTIDMGAGPIRALEWWTFDDGKVASLQAFYWDTATMLAAP